MAFDDATGREVFEGLDEDDYEPNDDDLELTGDDEDEPDDLELL